MMLSLKAFKWFNVPINALSEFSENVEFSSGDKLDKELEN